MNHKIKTILTVILAIVAAPILLLLTILSPLFINEARLQIIAIQSKYALERIEILKGRTAPVSSTPNGDGLTGSDSPAFEEFTVDDTVINIHRQVTESLSSQGFTVSESFAWTGSGNTSVYELDSYAQRGKEGILLRYRLAEEFFCDGIGVNGGRACPRDVIVTQDLSSKKAIELLVDYSTGGESYRDYGMQ